MSNAWLEEDEKQLRNLVALRLSASQIAARMPFQCSRNAVIGKCKRLGLRLNNGKRGGARRQSHAQIMPRLPRKPLAEPKPASPRVTRKPASPALKAVPNLPPFEPYIPREPAPILPPTSFEDRKPGQCCWPVNADKPFLYCGSDRQPGKRRSGKPREYCEAHERLRVTSGVML